MNMSPGAIYFISAGFARNQSTGFVGFVARVSGIGVGLGCAALILLLSVMNGFETELRQNLLSKLPHGEFIHVDNSAIHLTDELRNRVNQDPRVIGVLPVNKAFGLIQVQSTIKSAQVVGATEEYHNQKYSSVFDWQLLGPKDAIIVGSALMQTLNLKIGNKVQLLVPQASSGKDFSLPKSRWFTIVGQMDISNDLNSDIVVVSADVLTDMLEIPEGRTNYLEFVFSDPFEAQELIREYGFSFDQAVYLSSWYRTHGHLFYDIELVRTVIYIVLLLLICIACFNVISSLVISVKEQSKSIAILKTMGATDALISQIFMLKGIRSTAVGAFYGCIIGTIVAIYLTEILNSLEHITGIPILDNGIYFTNSIPSVVVWWNVLLAFAVSIVVGWMATIYPARQAAKLPPAENLH